MEKVSIKPTISIIVPFFNLEFYIKKCIDSILQQTFQNFELIIINDGSTDKSGEICDEYANKDSRIRIFYKENGGVSSARNLGIKEARGEFIGFVDGDDWIYEDMFQNLYELCTDKNSDIAICNIFREINGEVVNIEREEFINEMDNVEAMKQLFRGELYKFSLWNKLYRKSCFENIKFPEGRIHEDLSTTYKLFANANKVVFTNYTGYIYVKRESSILTARYNEKRLDGLYGWDEIIPFMNQNYSQLAEDFLACYVYWGVDNIYYILNQIENKNVKGQYLNRIQSYIRKYYKLLIMNNKLSLKYKYIITLFIFNVNLFYIFNNIIRFIKYLKPSYL